MAVTWPVDLDPLEQTALSVLVEQLPYLGRAESLVEASVVDELPRVDDCRTVSPGSQPTLEARPLRLLAPLLPLDFESLLVVPWRERAKGFVFPRAAEHLDYVSDGALTWRQKRAKAQRPVVEVIEWRLRGRGQIPFTAAVAYCDLLRSACLSKLNGEIEAERFVSGKGPDDRKSVGHHRHPHFLPVADSTGLFLAGLRMWVPDGLAANTSDRLAGIRWLNSDRKGTADFRPVSLYLQGTLPSAVAYPSSTIFETLTPYAPARHLRTDSRMLRSLRTEVSRELVERHLPEPAEVEFLLDSNRVHPLDFRRHRTKELLRHARRAFHLRLTFAEPVQGPIAIGALSHFGLGLFAAVPVG